MSGFITHARGLRRLNNTQHEFIIGGVFDYLLT